MKKLNLGCGRNIKPGWTNIDSYPVEGVDIVADIDDCNNIKLPFEDNSIDEFLLNHVFEHLKNPLSTMQEMHRIAKNGSRAILRVPYGSSDDASEDPTHVRLCFLNTFLYFSQPAYWRADYGYRGDWDVEKIILSVSRIRYSSASYEIIMNDVKHLRNIVHDMTVIMTAVKPIRLPLKELQSVTQVDFIFI